MAAYTYYCPKCGMRQVVVHIRYQPPIIRCQKCATFLERAIKK